MRFEGFSASPDIVGGRVWLSWQYALEALETPGDVPDVLLRRKLRDFAFPPLMPGDPYLVYDSAVFPPAAIPPIQIVGLPAEEGVEDGLRVVTETVSVSASAVEVQRRARSVFYRADGTPVRLRDALLDASGLLPHAPYYYELDDGAVPDPEALTRYRGVAAAGGAYGLNMRLHAMLPEAYRSPDDRRMEPHFRFAGVPETSGDGGELRRFIDMFGMGLDALRSSAEGLRNLRDMQHVEARWLPALGRTIGWEPSGRADIPRQRNELQTATRLFEVVGTVPGLSALVTHQTGWRAQVAEFAQNVARSCVVPRRSLHLRAELPSGAWRGADDAAPLLAFPTGAATGVGALPAVKTSTLLQPFALRPGMELTLTVDGDVPARVRFGPDDFADIGAATAGEVAAVVNAAFDTLEASAVGGAVVLRTVSTGPQATLAVEAAEASLLAVSAAPDGQLAAVADGLGRLRVLYEDWRDAEADELAAHDPSRDDAVPAAGRRAAPPMRAIERRRRQLMLKSWAYGGWRGEQPVPAWAGLASAPAAAMLPDGRLATAWLDGGRPQGAQLRLALATSRPPRPASIVGRQPAPFGLTPGTQVSFSGQFGSETFVVLAADYADPAVATAAEVVAAIGVQCPSLVAAATANGSVRVSTIAAGDLAWLSVDLAASTAARALGLGERRLAGRGDWDAMVDWSGPLAGAAAFGPVADPALCADPLGGMRVFWAEHLDALWRIRQAHWSERTTVATALGVSQRDGAGAWTTWTTVDGLASNDVRAMVADARGALWFATAGGLSVRRADGVWASFTTVDGLGSNDLRDLALLPDGTLWIATPAGISVRDPAGAFSVMTAAPGGLVSDDVRAVAADGLGNGWAATPTGVSRRGGDGRWRSWLPAEGLPGGTPLRLAVGPAGQVALAGSGGIGLYDGTAWRSFGVADGLLSADARGVAFGAEGQLFAATAGGLAWLRDRRWTTRSPADGLPTSDLRSIALLPDGRLALGTATGLIFGRPDAPAGGWAIATVADGLAAPVVVAVQGNWSTPVTLAAGGGGCREPRAQLVGGVTWLFWSQREQAAAGLRDSWSIRLRRYDPAVAGWSVEQAVTSAPASGAADREPAPQAAGAGVRVFFSSDRSGGRALWSVSLDAMGVAGPLQALTAGSAENSRPVPVTGPAGATWLICRSDAPIAMAQVALVPEPGAPRRASERVPEARALTHNAGTRTPVMDHAPRNLGRRLWGDYFAYTPDYPHLIDADTPTRTHLYTRRTIGLYLRQSPIGAAITADSVARLRQLLLRFLPINLRLALIIAPDPLVEFVYRADADIGEAWQDSAPFIDALGAIADSSTVIMPDVGVLISNDINNRSYAAALLATLRRRTWFPDLV